MKLSHKKLVKLSKLFLYGLILIAGHSFCSRDHSFASGLSDLSISEDDKPEAEVFASSTERNSADPDALANQFGQIELNPENAKIPNIDESRQSRPIVYFSTEFDAIATVRHARMG